MTEDQFNRFLAHQEELSNRMISSLCVAIEQLVIKSPDVTVPEIKVPDIHVPEIKAPDVHVPPFEIPTPIINVNVPDVIVPEIKIPEINVPTPQVTVNPPVVNVQPPDIHFPATVRESALPPYDSGSVQHTLNPIGEIWTLYKDEAVVAIVTITYFDQDKEEMSSFNIKTI